MWYFEHKHPFEFTFMIVFSIMTEYNFCPVLDPAVSNVPLDTSTSPTPTISTSVRVSFQAGLCDAAADVRLAARDALRVLCTRAPILSDEYANHATLYFDFSRSINVCLY